MEDENNADAAGAGAECVDENLIVAFGPLMQGKTSDISDAADGCGAAERVAGEGNAH